MSRIATKPSRIRRIELSVETVDTVPVATYLLITILTPIVILRWSGLDGP